MRSHPALRSATLKRASALARPYPTVDPARVRKVVTKSNKRVVGFFSSSKMRAAIPWESQLEWDCLHLMEVDNSVVAYQAQPEFLMYAHEGVDRRYCPDLAVRYRDGTEGRVEVKYQKDADDPENQELFAVFRATYAGRGIVFRVMTERDIRQEPLLANAKLMLRDRTRVPSERLRFQVAEIFNRRPPATLGELEEALGPSAELRRELYGMASRGHFALDLNTAPLSSDSRITSPFDYSKLGG